MSDIIKSVTLDLGKKQVTLTMKQAKALKEALDEMFGKEVIREREVIHEHDYWPWRWNQPYRDYWFRDRQLTPFQPSYTTCTNLHGETCNDVRSWNASFSDGNMILAVA